MASDYTPSGALTTLDNVKEYLGGTWDAAGEARIQNLILAATSHFETITRRQLLSAAISAEKYDSDGCSDVLLLRQWPVSAVSAVVEDSTTLASEDYELEAATGKLFRKSGSEYRTWTGGRRVIAVTYTAGYSTTPSDLCYAATVHVAWMHKRTSRLGERQQAITPDVSGIFMVDAMAPEVADILDRYRSVRV